MKHKRGSRGGFTAFMLLIVLLTAILLYGVINAGTVRVKYASASLKYLDYRLDGVKILYLSDLKISTNAQAKHAARLIKRLNELKPDIILIGGDISGEGLFSGIRTKLGISSEDEIQQECLNALETFILETNEINVKYGIYAVAGDSDLNITSEIQERSNIYFLNDAAAKININGATLPIYGEKSGRSFNFAGTGSNAMIVMFHDPSLYTRAALRASERNSDADSYLFLSGHLLGGQVKIGKSFAYQNDLNRKYTLNANSYGLYSDGSGIRMLLSQGIGTVGLPVRFFTAPTAYLITLKRG